MSNIWSNIVDESILESPSELQSIVIDGSSPPSLDATNQYFLTINADEHDYAFKQTTITGDVVLSPSDIMPTEINEITSLDYKLEENQQISEESGSGEFLLSPLFSLLFI